MYHSGYSLFWEFKSYLKMEKLESLKKETELLIKKMFIKEQYFAANHFMKDLDAIIRVIQLLNVKTNSEARHE